MLILTKPIKDEFFSGFIRRLCHINFINSPSEMLMILHKNFSPNLGRRESAFKVASLATGISETEIIWNHSHFPINLQFPFRNGRVNYTLEDRRAPGPTPPEWYRYRLCPDCLEQQKQEHGFSFWNRVHQLPSLYWCPWHKTALRQCRMPPSAPHMPSIETTDELIHPSVKSDIYKYHKILYFSEILTNAYKIPYGATSWSALSLISIILESHGFSHSDNNGKSKHLKNLAFDNFPKWWLGKIYEDVRKVPEQRAPAIDKVFRHRGWRYYEYALAIALLLKPEEWARYQVHDDALISIRGIERVNACVWPSIT
ncbi:TniQ family protein [Burkholderia pseudomallei]|uniref:TniQ family protein n=1 Tax=Burkholderia pseudomallei TaxID=28450 RepID=UPI001CB86387